MSGARIAGARRRDPAVGLAGPSAAVPEIGAATGQPPWFWVIRPADITVTLAL